MKALITGSQGFVGGYLRRELEENGYDVTGLDLQTDSGVIYCNLLNAAEVAEIICSLTPDVIIHLAGQANVGRSWQIPQKTMEINVNGAVNLMEAMRIYCPKARLVLVGSSDEYGNLGEAGKLVSETTPVLPQTPYAVSKVAQENMARVYVRAYDLQICMTRSFNHGGAGQRTGFMIPDFASGIVRVERGEADSVKVGNLMARRDYTHVRDVVRAYRLIAEKGQSGEVYNVGSGTVSSAQEILDKLIAMAACPIRVEQDPTRMRPSDTPVICCDHSKLTRDTGWMPLCSLNDILRDTMADYRSRQ